MLPSSTRSQKIIVVMIIREWSFSLRKQHLSCSFWQINLLSDYTSLNTRRHLEIFPCLRRKRSTLTFDVIENLAHKSRRSLARLKNTSSQVYSLHRKRKVFSPRLIIVIVICPLKTQLAKTFLGVA